MTKRREVVDDLPARVHVVGNDALGKSAVWAVPAARRVMGTVMTAMGGFTPEAFRVAWLVQYPVWLVAVIGVLVMRRTGSPRPRRCRWPSP